MVLHFRSVHDYIDCMCFNPVFNKMQEGKNYDSRISNVRYRASYEALAFWEYRRTLHLCSEEYWHSHFDEVQEALLQAKVLVYDIDGNIQGFIGLMNEYIAGIFVDKSCRSTGIGTQLLTYVKEKYDTLSLSVYQQNSRAVAFYHREGFSILSEGVDEDTGEKEYTMFWKKQF